MTDAENKISNRQMKKRAMQEKLLKEQAELEAKKALEELHKQYQSNIQSGYDINENEKLFGFLPFDLLSK